MRDDLRRKADDIWIIDCSPEGHQPEVNSRIFQGVQQPVCIVLASRTGSKPPGSPAAVHYQALPAGRREEKFEMLASLTLQPAGWTACSTDWRAPFLPAATGDWADYPPLEDLFIYSGSGVMPGRTWVIAPDSESLTRRWQALTTARGAEQEGLFQPHAGGDRHPNKRLTQGLHGHEARTESVAEDRKSCLPPTRYGFRSFDRQWIIPDNRLINRPNPGLWAVHSQRQVYLTALMAHPPSAGPAVTFTGLIPDLHHYKGSFGGRAFPLWRDTAGAEPNVAPNLLAYLGERYKQVVTAEDVMAYIAAVASHPAYTRRFQPDLVQAGLRIPLTADATLFTAAVALGRTVVWLHTFGERFADPALGRPAQAPRLPKADAPQVPARGAIPGDPERMPDTLGYDAVSRRLLVGGGYVEPVSPEVWAYEVSGKRVLSHWFSYRKANRERPVMGDRRAPSALCDLQPDHWLPEYTTELLNVINVLGRLVELEPAQAQLLGQICASPTITTNELRAAQALAAPETRLAVGEAARPSQQLSLPT